jgi:hypothetical protein
MSPVQLPLPGLVVDQLGFLTGIVLYVMLLVMVRRERTAEGMPFLYRRGRLPLLTGLFGLVWNVGALVSFGVQLSDPDVPRPVILAAAFTSLGFLPAVVVHSLLEGRETAASSRLIRTAVVTAYGLSASAGVLQSAAALRSLAVPSPSALWLLTGGFTALAALLLFMTRQQPIGRRRLSPALQPTRRQRIVVGRAGGPPCLAAACARDPSPGLSVRLR